MKKNPKKAILIMVFVTIAIITLSFFNGTLYFWYKNMSFHIKYYIPRETLSSVELSLCQYHAEEGTFYEFMMLSKYSDDQVVYHKSIGAYIPSEITIYYDPNGIEICRYDAALAKRTTCHEGQLGKVRLSSDSSPAGSIPICASKEQDNVVILADKFS